MRASPSGSALVAETVSVSVGLRGRLVIATEEIVGAELAIVTAAEVEGVALAVPSLAVTWTVIWSALSPLPAWDRSSVAAVAPPMFDAAPSSIGRRR